MTLFQPSSTLSIHHSTMTLSFSLGLASSWMKRTIIIILVAPSFLLFGGGNGNLLLLQPVLGFQTYKMTRIRNFEIVKPTTATTTLTRQRHQSLIMTRLFDESSSSNQGETSTGSGASVRFSGTTTTTTSTSTASTTDTGSTQTMNPLDTFISYMSSDIASIILGAIGLFVIVLHRWSVLDNDYDYVTTTATTTAASSSSSAVVDALAIQTRTDLLAVFACGSVLLNGITKLDVTAALSESVVLEGITVRPEFFETNNIINNKNKKDTMEWAMNSLLTATPAKSVVLLQQQQPQQRTTDTLSSSSSNDNINNNNNAPWIMIARAGVVPATTSTTIPDSTPILDRVGSLGNVKETYLPTLQALPGKRELTYLPSNTQLALLIPIDSNNDNNDNDENTTTHSRQVLVLGGNTAKSFTPRDVAWSRIVAERMGQA